MTGFDLLLALEFNGEIPLRCGDFMVPLILAAGLGASSSNNPYILNLDLIMSIIFWLSSLFMTFQKSSFKNLE